jgi:hypothetical protein
MSDLGMGIARKCADLVEGSYECHVDASVCSSVYVYTIVSQQYAQLCYERLKLGRQGFSGTGRCQNIIDQPRHQLVPYLENHVLLYFCRRLLRDRWLVYAEVAKNRDI